MSTTTMPLSQVKASATGGVPAKNASDRIVQVANLNLAEVATFSKTAGSTDSQFSTVQVQHSNGSGSIVLQFSGGGVMPAFAHDTSKHGTSVVFSLDDEEEVQALARAQAYVSKAVVCNKTTWSNSISERSDESITNSAVNLVAIGNSKAILNDLARAL